MNIQTELFRYAMEANLNSYDSLSVVEVLNTTQACMGGWTRKCWLKIDGKRMLVENWHCENLHWATERLNLHWATERLNLNRSNKGLAPIAFTVLKDLGKLRFICFKVRY